ncbi:MAG: hypothetical protein JXL67_09730 [Calditrichaeota bacterium]|nr:hypothetical protein [Calditrichota bacterium]
MAGKIPLNAQSLSVMPFFGYKKVEMESVNQDYRYKISRLAVITDNNFPAPENFDGNYAWGLHVNYRLEGGYFLYAGTIYYFEKARLNYDIPPASLRTLREVELFDFNIGVKYYPNYNTWRRFNFYGGAAVGYAFGWARSEFKYIDGVNRIDNQGDFFTGALSATFSAGITYRITNIIALDGAFGYHLADLGDMEGRLQISQILPGDPSSQLEVTDDNYITDENYNFGGLFAQIGLKFNISY